ncbi:MAG: hypothetical protein AB1772_07695 [Candidatus Zixiibacteriota bacterium]
MQEHERTIRPALAAIVLICFFMPFIKISCAGQPIVSITGLDLVLGKTIEPPPFLQDNPGSSGFDNPYGADWSGGADKGQGQWEVQVGDSTIPFNQSAGTESFDPYSQMGDSEMRVDTEPLTAAAMALAIIALLGTFGANRPAMTISAICSGGVAILLFIFRANAGGDMPSEFMGMISLEWAAAFWVALASAAALALFTAKVLSQHKPVRQKPRLVIQSRTDTTPSESLKH